MRMENLSRFELKLGNLIDSDGNSFSKTAGREFIRRSHHVTGTGRPSQSALKVHILPANSCVPYFVR